jgi:hypothetical protein
MMIGERFVNSQGGGQCLAKTIFTVGVEPHSVDPSIADGLSERSVRFACGLTRDVNRSMCREHSEKSRCGMGCGAGEQNLSHGVYKGRTFGDDSRVIYYVRVAGLSAQTLKGDPHCPDGIIIENAGIIDRVARSVEGIPYHNDADHGHGANPVIGSIK